MSPSMKSQNRKRIRKPHSKGIPWSQIGPILKKRNVPQFLLSILSRRHFFDMSTLSLDLRNRVPLSQMIDCVEAQEREVKWLKGGQTIEEDSNANANSLSAPICAPLSASPLEENVISGTEHPVSHHSTSSHNAQLVFMF